MQKKTFPIKRRKKEVLWPDAAAAAYAIIRKVRKYTLQKGESFNFLHAGLNNLSRTFRRRDDQS